MTLAFSSPAARIATGLAVAATALAIFSASASAQSACEYVTASAGPMVQIRPDQAQRKALDLARTRATARGNQMRTNLIGNGASNVGAPQLSDWRSACRNVGAFKSECHARVRVCVQYRTVARNCGPREYWSTGARRCLPFN